MLEIVWEADTIYRSSHWINDFWPSSSLLKASITCCTTVVSFPTTWDFSLMMITSWPLSWCWADKLSNLMIARKRAQSHLDETNETFIRVAHDNNHDNNNDNIIIIIQFLESHNASYLYFCYFCYFCYFWRDTFRSRKKKTTMTQEH